MKSWPNVRGIEALQQQLRKKKMERHCLESNVFPPYLTQAANIYVATSHSVVQQGKVEISEQKLLLYNFCTRGRLMSERL